MANWTDTTVAIAGKLRDVATLVGWLHANYCVADNEEELAYCYAEIDGEKYDCQYHFWRLDPYCTEVYRVEVDGGEIRIGTIPDDARVTVYVSTSCAWSVGTSLLGTSRSYYSDYAHKPGLRGMCLEAACNMLRVRCEVFSDDLGFCEHVLVDEGGCLLINENDVYREYPIFDVKTFEEYKQWVEDEGSGDELDYVTEEMFNEAKAKGEEHIYDSGKIKMYEWELNDPTYFIEEE